jgi:curli biogenesis system outer membrane secretion channel CsgG
MMKNKSIFAIILSFLILQLMALTACSSLGLQTSPQRKEIEVKDVPVEARQGEELRKRILVLPFIDSEIQRSQNVTTVARRVVVEDLINSRQFVVVNNSDFQQDLGAFLKENKEYDLAAVSRIAAGQGIAAVVEGRILEIRARRVGDEVGVFRKLRANVDVTVQIRVFGTKTGREILQTVKKASIESETTRMGETSYSDRALEEDPQLIRDGIRKAFKTTVAPIVKAVEKLSWEGRVALVNGDRIYINAGRISGLQVGDVLKVTEDGDEVFDPESGSFIGYAPGRMKGTLEVVSYFGKDGAIGVVHSGSGFKENDRVELY